MRVILGRVRLYKVWTRGEIVLPKAMRDRLGIRPGDEVDIFERDGEIVIRKASPKADAAEQSAR